MIAQPDIRLSWRLLLLVCRVCKPALPRDCTRYSWAVSCGYSWFPTTWSMSSRRSPKASWQLPRKRLDIDLGAKNSKNYPGSGKWILRPYSFNCLYFPEAYLYFREHPITVDFGLTVHPRLFLREYDSPSSHVPQWFIFLSSCRCNSEMGGVRGLKYTPTCWLFTILCFQITAFCSGLLKHKSEVGSTSRIT